MALLLSLGYVRSAAAWGPGTHVQLAADLLANSWMLPAALGLLLSRHRREFTYGNVAADVVFAKKFSAIKQACHHWRTGFSILERARTDGDRAFAYGYLAHLAADTVAHGKFLPRQMALSGSTINFGHLYWELRADAQVPAANWITLRRTIQDPHPGARALMHEHLRDTLLSFGMNERVFARMNMLVCMRGWRRSMAVWSRLSRWPLPEQVVTNYREESLERITDVLRFERRSRVLHDDPNGNASLAYATAQRRQMRQMRRARIQVAPVVHEAAMVHASGNRTPRSAESHNP